MILNEFYTILHDFISFLQIFYIKFIDFYGNIRIFMKLLIFFSRLMKEAMIILSDIIWHGIMCEFCSLQTSLFGKQSSCQIWDPDNRELVTSRLTTSILESNVHQVQDILFWRSTYVNKLDVEFIKIYKNLKTQSTRQIVQDNCSCLCHCRKKSVELYS